MKKLLFSLLMLVILCGEANSTTYNLTAEECGTASTIQGYITNTIATNGDIITCPTGSYTWTTQISSGGKGFTFQGAGARTSGEGGTEVFLGLNNNNATVFNLTATGRKTEITGWLFKALTSGGYDKASIVIGSTTGSSYVLIHDNKFVWSTTTNEIAISTSSEPNLVIYNNIFNWKWQVLQFYDAQHTINPLTRPIGWGQTWADDESVKWTFVEGNTFTKLGTLDYSTIWNMEYGGKVTFRYNTLTDYQNFIGHGSCWSCPSYPFGCIGLYAADIGHNTFYFTSSFSGTYWISGMAGTWRIHDNNLYKNTGAVFSSWSSDSNYYYSTHWQDVRFEDGSDGCQNHGWALQDATEDFLCSDSTQSIWLTAPTDAICTTRGWGNLTKKFCSNSWTVCSGDGECSGGTCTRSLDGATAYPGFNTIGTGRLNPNGTVDVEPVYSWNNKVYACDSGGGNCSFDKNINIRISNYGDYKQSGRDWYNETNPSYTEYTCPHPKTGLTGSCSGFVTGLSGYNIGSGGRVIMRTRDPLQRWRGMVEMEYLW